MRLPADATLIVIDVLAVIDDPCRGPRDNSEAETKIGALIAAWRAERLPLIHVFFDSTESDSPYTSHGPGHRFRRYAMPLAGETLAGANADSAFVGTGLERLLDEFGATTLVLCGALTPSFEGTARDAASLGYQAFIVADACWAIDKVDRHRKLPAEDALALSLLLLQGEYGRIVDAAAALDAAATAKARQRRAAGKAQ